MTRRALRRQTSDPAITQSVLGENERSVVSADGDRGRLLGDVLPSHRDLRGLGLGREFEDDFNGLFRKEYSRVVKVVMYAGATFEEAEDAVSAAMARAYACWPVLHYPAAWVRKVALHLYFKKVGKDRIRGHAETAASRLECLDRVSTGAHEEPDERSRVIAVLRCLSPAQRTAMALTFDGYTPTEIAKLLHQNAATVRSNLRHARMRLRDEFGKPTSHRPHEIDHMKE